MQVQVQQSLYLILSLSRSLSHSLRVAYLLANLLPVEGGTLALQPAGRAIMTREARTRHECTRAPFTLDRRGARRRVPAGSSIYDLSSPPENAPQPVFAYLSACSRAAARRNVKRAMAYLKFHGCVPSLWPSRPSSRDSRFAVAGPREPGDRQLNGPEGQS